MDIQHVINFRDMMLAFRKEGIEGIDIEELAGELSGQQRRKCCCQSRCSRFIMTHPVREDVFQIQVCKGIKCAAIETGDGGCRLEYGTI